MILFFGTRPGKTKLKSLPGVRCPHCVQTGTLTVSIASNYFHLFWIKLFKISTSKIAECSHCKRVYYRNEFTLEMENAMGMD
ncbi:zinc-ribbon domain-containing protein [Ulvibacterium marinum]|uniref:zinc-ribbon domain-containing protein n=1 Tax=Ulvibacterium marinum TaxID=2419782 RepID=UPI0024950F97|nr:zinc-ribbon domain-containing protein [Ulvibacterium marinum]